ncbi:hypothetical protein BH10PSE4_BH10PSE4_43140 [soil metagenome]
MFARLATATAALALMSGVAMAQSTAPQAAASQGMPVNPDPTAAAPADQTLPPADPSAATMAPTDPTAATTSPADTGMAADTAGRVSSMPAEQQATLKAGDPNVTSNPPVADTPENRKLYGKPMSNAGKHSAAKGN